MQFEDVKEVRSEADAKLNDNFGREILPDDMRQSRLLRAIWLVETREQVEYAIKHEYDVEDEQDVERAQVEARLGTDGYGRVKDPEDEHDVREVIPLHVPVTVGWNNEARRLRVRHVFLLVRVVLLVGVVYLLLDTLLHVRASHVTNLTDDLDLLAHEGPSLLSALNLLLLVVFARQQLFQLKVLLELLFYFLIASTAGRKRILPLLLALHLPLVTGRAATTSKAVEQLRGQLLLLELLDAVTLDLFLAFAELGLLFFPFGDLEPKLIQFFFASRHELLVRFAIMLRLLTHAGANWVIILAGPVVNTKLVDVAVFLFGVTLSHLSKLDATALFLTGNAEAQIFCQVLCLQSLILCTLRTVDARRTFHILCLFLKIIIEI